MNEEIELTQKKIGKVLVKRREKIFETFDEKIMEMKEQIKDMDQELERYHKNNSSLELTISDLKLKLDGDEATGVNIVRVALSAPLKQIAFNAGLEPGVVADKVSNLPAGHGLNAATNDYEDLLAAGINDPVKVTRSALQNAASIAALFLTTEAVVADKPEKAGAPAGDPTGGMGGMDF